MLPDCAMIEVKPKIQNYFTCPACKSAEPMVNDVMIHSVHAMADCICRSCHLQFNQILPIGHNVQDPLAVGKADGKYYNLQGTAQWLFDSVVKAREGARHGEVRIDRRVFRNCDDVVILNTLDYLYGHVLLKLYNSLHHLDHDKSLGLIVIIPKMFEWLIPGGCAEAWVVDLKLNELAYNYDGIQKFVATQFQRFRSIYLSKAYSHPDFTTLDISRLTGVKPFDLSEFKERPPAITFVLRQDRWWFTSVGDYFFYRVCRKLKLMSWGAQILSQRQNRLVKRTIRRIRRALPQAEIFIAGLGRAGDFGSYGIDKRQTKIDVSTEIDWCQIYAKSHVVIGVHGSNMLLPTALAAGCVEVLPEERYGNMVQDISVRYSDRRQLFFYRFADQYSKPRSVAAKVIAMIRDYDTYHKNMCQNLYTKDSDPLL
jgi:hypothetical protein